MSNPAPAPAPIVVEVRQPLDTAPRRKHCGYALSPEPDSTAEVVEIYESESEVPPAL